MAVARWTYEHAGKYKTPTLEQWELGFMKDTNPDSELAAWVIISLALESWVNEKSKPVSDKRKKDYICTLSAVSLGCRLDDTATKEDHKVVNEAKKRFDRYKEMGTEDKP